MTIVFLLCCLWRSRRLERERNILLRKTKARGVTADQVAGARRDELDKDLEELRKKNAELESQLNAIKYVFCLFEYDGSHLMSLAVLTLSNASHSNQAPWGFRCATEMCSGGPSPLLYSCVGTVVPFNKWVKINH